MDWLFVKRLPIDQTTRIRFIRWIILNHFTLENTDENLIKRKMIRLRFLIGVICNSDMATPNCANNIFYIHQSLTFFNKGPLW